MLGPFDFFLPSVFDGLPEAVTERLLCGVLARKQAAQIGLTCWQAATAGHARQPLLLRLGLELTLLAFDLDPGNAALAKGALAMAGQAGVPLAADAMAALQYAGEDGLGAPWREALALADRAGDWETFGQRFAAEFPAAGGALASRIGGLAALASGREDRIAAWRAALGHPTTPGLAWLLVQATLLLDGGAAGERALRAYLTRWPWCGSALLALYDRRTGRSDLLAELPGELAIFLYSFNKADDLASTLEDLCASRLPRHRVFVLDNGSTDATPDVLAAFRDRLGSERFFPVRAPVNVGAPAGRNWLKALPEAQGADFIAYLDDDLALPPDWACRLGAAVSAYPGAGVYGCRVVDAGRPAVLQAAEFHLELKGPGEPLAATDLQLQAPDLGQFAYCRPALSVTGCCHLFSAEALAAGGDFDIRFSPSQFDDFDRDLRAALEGRFAVFTGHLAVGHKRRSGGDARRQRAAGANAHGNMQKLQGKYDAGDHRRLRREQQARLLTDIRKKAIWLSRHDAGEGERP